MMTDKRGLAVVGVRAISGLVGVAVAVIAVVGAVIVPWPTIDQRQPSIEIQPVPAEQQRVCPGPLYTLALDAAVATAASSIGSVSVAASANVNDGRDLAVPDNTLGDQHGGPRLLIVPVADGVTTPPLLAASQSQRAQTETESGLAVAACTEAVASAWLVGGSSDIGRTTLVILNNPSSVQAAVDLTVSGETGRVDAPGATGIIVPPGAQRIVSLAGLAPNLKSPVVQVQSRGGLVQATLQQSIVRGLAPGGVEIIAPTNAPAQKQTIAGVTIVPMAASGISSDDEDELSDDQPAMRLFVPGDVDATVNVRVLPEGGTGAGTSLQATVPAGIATEVPLTGLEAGTFTIDVQSDVPVIAAAKTSVDAAGVQDFAWFTASAPIAGEFLVVPADGPSPTLHAVNSSETDTITLVLRESGAADVSVEIPAGAAVSLPLLSGREYEVASDGAVVAAVNYAGVGLSSSFAVPPANPLDGALPVYTH